MNFKITKIINTAIYILLSFLLFFPPIFHGAVEPWVIFTIHIITASILFLWIIRSIIEKEFSLIKTPLDIPFLIFIAISLIYTINTVYPYGSFKEFLKILNYIAIYYISVNFIKERKIIKAFTWIIIISGTGLASYGLYHYYSGITKVVSPSYVCHNHFAGFMELSIPLALLLIFQGETGLLAAGGILSVIMGLALVYSKSRGALLAFLAASIIMALLILYKKSNINFKENKKKWIFINIITWVLVIILFAVPFVAKEKFAPIIEEIEKGDDLSFSCRVPVWKICKVMIEDQNYLGSGLGTFTLLFPQYKTTDSKAINGVFVNAAHCDYLQITIESGLPGLLSFLLILLAFYITAFLYIIYRPEKEGISPFTAHLIKKDQIYLIGYLTAIISLSLHGIGDFNFQIPANNIYFYMIMGLSISTINITKKLRESFSEKEKSPLEITISGKKLTVFLIIASIILTFLTSFSIRGLLSKYYQKKGMSYESKLLWEKALEEYEIAIKMDPGNSYNYIQAGFTCSKLAIVDDTKEKWTEEAIKYYEKACALNPYESATYFYLANLYTEQGKDEKAEKAFLQLIKLAPCNYRFRLSCGSFFQEKGETKKAIEQYEKYLLLRRDKRVESLLEELRKSE